MRKLPFILVIITLALFSCTSADEKVKVPEDVISPSDMISLLVDVHLADAAIHQQQQKGADVPQFTASLYRSVMEKHQLQSGDFSRSMEFYSHHPKLLRQIYEEVIGVLSTEQSRPNPRMHHRLGH